MSARYAPAAAPGNNAEWFVICFQDDDPDSWRVLRRAHYTGSLRGAETIAQELLMQCRVASRNLWPCWAEVWNDDNVAVSSFGEVPEERRASKLVS